MKTRRETLKLAAKTAAVVATKGKTVMTVHKCMYIHCPNHQKTENLCTFSECVEEPKQLMFYAALYCAELRKIKDNLTVQESEACEELDGYERYVWLQEIEEDDATAR